MVLFNLIQELVQNAEDAGAHRVRFVYDKNSYAVSKLHSPAMAPFQVSCCHFLRHFFHCWQRVNNS